MQNIIGSDTVAVLRRAERLSLENLSISIAEAGGRTTKILDVPRLTVEPGETVGITGPSGAGKTSLLYAIAGLIVPSTGRILWGERSVTALSEGARDRWRRETIGLVFQDFSLLPELCVFGNIVLPASFDHWRTPKNLRERAFDLARRVGLDAPRRRVSSLSRGEQQRVAVARALLRRPNLILADEPTASLDAENGAVIAALLSEAARESGATLVVVSHDARLLGQLGRIIRLERGRIIDPAAGAA